MKGYLFFFSFFFFFFFFFFFYACSFVKMTEGIGFPLV